ncbi:MAG TPA: nickel-dependent lactate racemase [Desulfomonilaceae bacterium]|nr:nickel-dependent lactate racemase [Desulfomonilaceae bacterium]
MNQTVEIPWGGDALQIRMPSRWRILGELKPAVVQAARSPQEACKEALAAPIGAQRLASRDLAQRKILIIADDHSRPTPVRDFIGPVLDELAAAGVREGDIRILLANGVHRASRPEEIECKLGREVVGRFAPICHDAYDPQGLEYVGTTSRGTRVVLNKLVLQADLILCLGALEPHLLMGFGGGLKMIIPGCAAAETVGRNHLQGVDPDDFDYVGVSGAQSPMRLDLEEGAALAGKEIFIVNAAMDAHAHPVQFFCGDPVKAHRGGESFVEGLARLDVPEQSDAVLTNSFPMDLDLRQSIKCVGNSLYACKPGGVMMGCLRCDQGIGEMPTSRNLPYPVMKALLKIIGKHRILGLVEKAKKDQPVEEIFVGHFALQMLRRNHLAIFSDSSALPPDIGKRLGVARSFTAAQNMVAWAASKVPKNATVWVVPHGGATYARPEHLMNQ